MALFLLWTLLPLAAAQSPGLTASLTPASSDARWMVSEVASKRFFGEEIAGPTFTAGEEVELILQDGDSARIRQGTRYGWVPASTLTATAPLVMPPTPMPSDNPLLGGLSPLLPAPAPAPASAPVPTQPVPTQPVPTPPGAPNTP